MSATVFGIDLGTTFSAIAHVDEFGQPQVILNAENSATTPSVVYFESLSNVIVGQPARESGRIDPANYVELIKRNMGDPDHRRYLHGQEFRPEQISALILAKLKKDAEEALGRPVTDAVITVPAYFSESQRTATEQAGQIAGLNVRGIIPEPTAAAIAYAATDAGDQTVLVYDLGGGTFDVTVMSITGGKVEAKGIEGDHDLGGRNWDEDVVNYLAMQWQAETGSSDDPRGDLETNQELFKQAEEAKRNLSRLQKAPLKVSHNGQSARLELTREKFEELTAARLERTIALTKQALAATGNPKIDKILLVGGSSYMPQVPARLKQEFPTVEQQLFDPDKAVALGAAIYATNTQIQDTYRQVIEKMFGKEAAAQVAAQGLESLPQAQQDLATAQVGKLLPDVSPDSLAAAAGMRVVNACSKNFGIEALDDADRPIVYYLIRRNTPVPATCEQVFGTRYANQSNVTVKIFEADGASPPDDPTHPACNKIKEFELSLPPGLPAEHSIPVRFSLSEDGGRLRIEAEDRANGRRLDESVQASDALMPEELSAMRDGVLKIKINQ